MPPHLEGEMNMNLKHGQRSPVPEGARRGSPKEMGKGPEIDLKKKKKKKKKILPGSKGKGTRSTGIMEEVKIEAI